ncbi:hypothetical protein O6H91_09G101700 [Diphasiastrum complanatum]|nr:hypothetical protein O6H91_09G101700 [Diphasiastrum complanatum]
MDKESALRSRLHQFFPAKKKKSTVSSSLSEKSSGFEQEKSPAKLSDHSPHIKSSLEGILVNCGTDTALSKSSFPKNISAVALQQEFPVNYVDTKKRFEEGTHHFQSLRSCSASKICHQEQKNYKGCSGHTNRTGDLETADWKERLPAGRTTSPCCIASTAEDALKHGVPREEEFGINNKVNVHLSQFATEFLSMCCSGIGSAKDVHLESQDEDSKYAKRNSNCLDMDRVDPVTVKKQRINGFAFQVTNFIESRETPCVEECRSQIPSDTSAIKVETAIKLADKRVEDIGQHGDADVECEQNSCADISKARNGWRFSNKVDEFPTSSTQLTACGRAGEKDHIPIGFPSLLSPHVSNMACGNGPDNEDARLLATPHSCRSQKVIRITPKGGSVSGWLKHNSIFSPGDAFWEEAIEVTDGVLAFNDNDKVEPLQKRTPKEEVNQSSDSSLTPVNGVDTSCIRGRSIEKDDPGLVDCGNAMELESASKCEIGSVGHKLNVPNAEGDSPLPIRRFDFSCPENSLYDANGSMEDSPQGQSLQLPNKGPLSNEGNNNRVSTPVVEEDAKRTNIHELLEKNEVPVLANIESMPNLSDWLPAEVCEVYANKGLKKLYPWQVDCLQMDGVIQGKSLVYCASTSAGKSLVAEILMLRQVLLSDKKAMLVLPYVALCSEKAEHLESLLGPLGRQVRSFFGAQGSANLPKDTSVAVCTIEKANFLINKLLEEARLSEIGIVVIDELHMVGDKERGYLLELMLTKLRYAAGLGETESGKSKSGPFTAEKKQEISLQIVGMSATMSNVRAVASWLLAAVYETAFRPVPLDEFVKVGNTIYNRDMEVARTIRNNANLGGKDPEHIVELCHEVVRDGHSVLLFCSSRRACETSALHVAKYLPAFSITANDNIPGYKDGPAAVEELRRSPAGIDPILSETLPAGVAYHHAGLTAEERDVIESCYKQGIVRVLAATSTLAAGVNLPARRVIFRQPKVGRDFLDGTRYRQMAGRAGRAGIDVKGESIMVCKPEELNRMITIMREGCQPLQSCLAEDKNGMMRALLEVVAGGMVQSAADVHRYVRCTLLNSTQPFEDVVKSAQDSLRWLCHKKLVEWDQETEMYTATPLGKATFGSSLSPDESLVVFEDLAKAREGFVLASDLHLVYLVTPIYVDMEPNWALFYQRFVQLSSIDQKVGNRVGVTEPFLMRMAHGAPVIQLRSRMTRNRSPKQKSNAIKSPGFSPNGLNSKSGHLFADQTLRACRRFFVALMLSKLVQEVPLMEVCDSFQVPRGTVQALQDSAGRFAAMISAFCGRLGWFDFEGLVSKFQNRVSFGVRAEIVDLTQIPFVKAIRARALYKSGFRTVQAVAEASLPELMKALYDTSKASQDVANNLQHRIRLGATRKIKNAARQIVLERAEEARVAAFTAVQALGIAASDALSRPISMVVVPDAEDIDDSFVVEAQRDSPDRNKKSFEETEKESSGFRVWKSAISNKNTNAIESKVVEVRQSCNLEQKVCKGDEVGADISKRNLMDDASAVFGGSGIAHVNSELAHEGTKIEQLDKGPTDVDRLVGGFQEFFKKWQAVDEFFFDLHFKEYHASLTEKCFEINGMAICWQSSPVYYVSLVNNYRAPINQSNVSAGEAKLANDADCLSTDVRKDLVSGTEKEMVVSRWNDIRSIFQAQCIKKVVWDLKPQLHVLKLPIAHISGPNHAAEERADEMEDSQKNDVIFLIPIELEEPFIDVRVAAWLLWPDEESNRRSTLEQMVKKRLAGETAAAASRAGRWLNQIGQISQNGCCRRVAQVRALHLAFWKLLATEGLHEPLLQVEMPLVKVLACMETWGLGVDMETCWQYKKLIGKKTKSLEEKAHQFVGKTFSLYMPADISNVLYKHLNLPMPPGCIKGKQHPSTDKQALEYLRDQHPVVEIIREHRVLSKLLHSTIGTITTWAKQPFGDKVLANGKKSLKYEICGHWLQTSTATGRLSMEDPNLQCVEHCVSFSVDKEMCDSAEAKDSDVVEVNARKLFVPTQDNWVLISADYSQIEVRLMAHFSGDAKLIALLKNPCGDLFRMIAAQWTCQAEVSVTEKQREHTKRLVYGILYGMGVSTLAEQLECSVADANTYYEKFKASFPGMTIWLQQVVDNCRQKG